MTDIPLAPVRPMFRAALRVFRSDPGVSDQRRPIRKGFVGLSPFYSKGSVAQPSWAEVAVWYDRCLLIAAESFNVV